MRVHRLAVVAIWLLLTLTVGATRVEAQADPRCERLRTAVITDGAIESADTVRGPYVAPAFRGQPEQRLEAPDRCVVRGTLRPGPQSTIRFVVWLPLTGWTGRLEMSGNGGFAGSVPEGDMLVALRRGSVTSGSDTGHDGTRGQQTEVWGRNPDAVIDFGHRAVHANVVAAKALIAAFYGQPARHAYFFSCSNGGRQGLTAAQRYPEDFDGIIAGAPAYQWTRLTSFGAALQQRFATQPEARIPADRLPALRAAALAACDAGDGVTDGLVDDPRTCRFDPAMLACRGEASPTCLTPPQVETVRLIYGQSRFPAPLTHFEPGTESSEWNGWMLAAEKSAQAAFATGTFRDLVRRDPAWTTATFDIDKDLAAAQDRVAPVLDATNPDLSRFFARGGRLILFHGWLDAAIPAGDSIEYFEAVGSRLGATSRDAASRLYLVPGLGHCAGGPGFTQFGTWFDPAFNGPAAPTPPPAASATRHMDEALRAWVEQGRAPAAIVGTRTKQDGAQETRPLCPYPQRARWDGKGDRGTATSFTCAAP